MTLDQCLKSTGAGSAIALSRRLGIAPPLLSQWRTGARKVPAERCIDIERATGGAVTCEELRPDLADRWSYLRGTTTHDSPTHQEAA